MDDAIVKVYRAARAAAKRDPIAREFLKHLDEAEKYVLSNEVIENAKALRRAHVEDASELKLPETSRLPFEAIAFVTKSDSSDQPVMYVLHRHNDGVAVWVGVDVTFGQVGVFFPGTPNYQQLKLDAFPDDFRFNKSAVAAICLKAAFTVAVINRPKTCLVQQKVATETKERIRFYGGRTADCWTHVSVRPGSVTQPKRAGVLTDRHLPLHTRSAHWAWVPSQRQTPKGIWLGRGECGKRGPGWYVQRPEGEVGDARYGVKVQIRDVAMPGEKAKRPRGQNAEFNEERKSALAAAQRLLTARAGQAQSAALH